MQTLSLHLLGSPYIERNGALVHVDTRKAIALLAYLVVNPGYQSRDTLAALLWPENDQVSARGALRRTISTLNTALGGVGLEIEREAIAFDESAVWCDLIALNTALRTCEKHGHSTQEVCQQCLTPLSQAVDLYKGDFLKGFTLRDSAEFDLWQFHQTEHLRYVYSAVLEKLIRLYAEAGQYPPAIELAKRLLLLDPLHEPSHRQLMQLYGWSGQRSLALRQYTECVRTLDQELGVRPLEETSRLYQLLLEDDLNQSSPGRNLESPMTAIALKADDAPLPLPLVGRDTELSHLDSLYSQTKNALQIVVVEGETGIGKSRLVDTFLLRARAKGSLQLIIRCYENEAHIPYAAVIRSLQNALRENPGIESLADYQLNELARLIPDLRTLRPGISVPALTKSKGAQSRLFEAICQTFCALVTGENPGMWVFEDLQWVDSATFDVFTYLLHRIMDIDAMLFLSWRTEDVSRTHRLRSLLTDYGRSGGKIVNFRLSRLDEKAVNTLVHLSGASAETSLAERLYQESEGLPLFLNEYLVLLRTYPAALDNQEWMLPMGIQDLVRSRLTHLSETAAQILGAAAVLGRSFDIDLLQECSGRNEVETTDGLDELLQRGIIKEFVGNVPAYEFTHEKLREVVYQDITIARKRLLHRRSAQALVNQVRQTEKLAIQSARIAHHYHSGGQDNEAVDYYFLAGIHARRLYANREALTHFETAIALGYANAASAYHQIGDLYTLLGNYRDALQSYQTGIAHAEPAMRPILEHALGKVYQRLGEWELAERYFQSALDLLAESAFVERAALLTDWSLTKYGSGQIEQAEQLAESALTIAEQSRSAMAIAQAHNIQGILARKLGQFDQAFPHLRQSLDLTESLGDPGIHAAVLNNLALTYLESGQHVEAQSLFEQALEDCKRQGDCHHEAALHNNLADLFHAMKQPDLAMQHLKKAVSLFAQVGVSSDTMKSEIWKLAEW